MYKHIYDADLNRFVRFAKNVWNIEEKESNKAIALAAFVKEIGLPATFKELGIPEDTDCRAIADSANITAGCCKELTAKEIYEILLECK